MGILNDLYFGKVYPFQNVVPEDKEYYPLIKKIGEESDYLKSKLPEGDRARFENYQNLLHQSEIMQSYANFGQGYRLGVALLIEGLTAKECNTDQEPSKGENIKVWSKDWEHFDWLQVRKKFEEMEGKESEEKANYDVGISRNEFLEYLDWLNKNDNEGFCKAILSMQLAEMGLDESQVESLVSHPDILVKALEMVHNENNCS